MDVTLAVSDACGPSGSGNVERVVPPVTLRSVQQYRSQDEYVVVMKEDLAEWFNDLYDMTMTCDDLFDRLETGVLLCRYACVVDDAVKSCAESVVYRERGVESGSFQARVNVAAFLAWCRRPPLQMPDDLLFETGDLICHRASVAAAERNERQVALCLLEVGRRSAALRVGLPAPQLVRLEEQIDAEIHADDNCELPTSSDCDKDELDGDDNGDNSPPSNSRQFVAARSCTSPAAHARGTGIRPPRMIISNSIEGPISAETTIKSNKSGSVWQRRRYKPIIPVDMMSLDEMVCHFHLLVA